MSRPAKPKPERVRISAETFKQCLTLLGWSQAEAARRLGVHDRKRIGDWASNRRPVPPYIASALATHVDRALARKGI